MLSATTSIEIALLPYREWAADRSNPLQRESENYMTKLLVLLESRKNLPKAVAALRDEQLGLRLKAMALLSGQKHDLKKWYLRKEKELRGHEADEGKEVLVWNMLFALDVSREVRVAAMDRDLDLEKVNSEQLAVLSGIGFEQFEAAITLGVPHAEAARTILAWLYSSFDLEVGLLMGDAVLSGDVKVSPARNEDLNAFLVPAAQTYGACARLMRLVPVNDVPFESLVQEPVPASYVREQKKLAELGIEDWFKLWD